MICASAWLNLASLRRKQCVRADLATCTCARIRCVVMPMRCAHHTLAPCTALAVCRIPGWVLWPGSIVVALQATLGAAASLTFLGCAAGAILLLEAVSYIQHYGLQRRRLPSGAFEKVAVEHSWDANYLVSSATLLRLQRHAHHHLQVRFCSGRLFMVHVIGMPSYDLAFSLGLVLCGEQLPPRCECEHSSMQALDAQCLMDTHSTQCTEQNRCHRSILSCVRPTAAALQAHRPYHTLDSLPGAPKLPAGYPLMVMIALLPPLWFAIMNPRVHAYRLLAEVRVSAAQELEEQLDGDGDDDDNDDSAAGSAERTALVAVAA